MLYRKAYAKLEEWKHESHRKALCIVGARQIGKTTIIREFGHREYKYFVEINFATDQQAAGIFADSFEADRLITNLTAYVRQPMEPHNTLIFFDEVQECPRVRTAIKFLVEDGRFDYVESGSLLGQRQKEILSYPVGFEEIYQMFPMDFEEFLLANSVQDSTIQYLQECFEKLVPVSDSVHNTMCRLFYSYIVVGGMPEAVRIYTETHDIGQVVSYQREILELYRLDIAKYAFGNDRIKIKAIFDSIPAQLNEKNRRFVLRDIDPNGRQNRYENSFLWLADAGVALPCYNVTEPRAPLQLNEKHSLFKLFLCDTGLLCAACMENIQLDLLQGNMKINMGSILENMMAQQLKANGFSLNYFDTKKIGELDFLVSKGMKVLQIEVKSGNNYKKHPALNRIKAVEVWKNNPSYVFCKGNIETENGITYLPWYEVMFLRQEEIPLNIIYEVDISKL
ncbi:DUF4143 domain-containing protein [bacterium 1XD21-13]|nr:DUF4143 domain-containing protein [bacterium 1XD21-13]